MADGRLRGLVVTRRTQDDTLGLGLSEIRTAQIGAIQGGPEEPGPVKRARRRLARLGSLAVRGGATQVNLAEGGLRARARPG
jgi:hypothetical protein